MKINESHAGWLLHSTMVNKDGSLLGHACYQLTSSIDMLELYRERNEWAKANDKYVTTHFHLIQIFVYDCRKMWAAGSYPTEELLEFYAKHEQALIDANKP
jgi:hypothetical protein